MILASLFPHSFTNSMTLLAANAPVAPFVGTTVHIFIPLYRSTPTGIVNLNPHLVSREAVVEVEFIYSALKVWLPPMIGLAASPFHAVRAPAAKR